MFEAFIFTILIIFCLLGISEVIHIICNFILKPANPPFKVLLTFLKGPEAEQQLISVKEELRWSGKQYADKILAVTSDLSAESIEYLKENYKSDNIFFIDSKIILNEIEKTGVFYDRN